MKQFKETKEKFKDAIVFFRLGDFYEMFGDDAKTASKVLQIALTSRDRNKEEPTPMCGVPYFAAESYIAKLIAAGHKVAICEQVEDPREAKGVVKREVVRVITPGTFTPENPKENNYIASFFPLGTKHGIAVADISTGEFLIFETENPLEDELERFEPREVLYPEALGKDIHYQEILKNFFATPADDFLFDYPEAYKALLAYFKVSSLEAFGCEGFYAAITSAGALLSVLKENQKEPLSFAKLTPLREGSHMFIDASTRKNLELVQNLKDGRKEGTLLWALDETLTPMGGRYMRGALLRPLINVQEIKRNLYSVKTLVEDYELLDVLRNSLRKMQDLERLSARVNMGTANARDLIALKSSLKQLPAIRKSLLKAEDALLKEIGHSIGDFSPAVQLIEESIADHPPLSLREGGIIKKGHHPEVDELRTLSSTSKDYITRLELEEKKRTGIGSLKVGYNRVFGYFIEVTKPNLAQVPQHYIRKQTLVNAERFITSELKDYEIKALGAEERLKVLEYEVFMETLEKLKGFSQALSGAAAKIGKLDFLLSLAVVAKRHNYVMPEIDEGLGLTIADGRHPVIERLNLGERFIPNSIEMDGEQNTMLIITGPNMAGKSTYMRQTALIVLMIQMGSFVPAESAHVGLVDRIFTRIGASDFLTMGQSTFMVEMLETANILHNATQRSLLILDEVGRGTSTFDGISIAWATAEFLAKNIKARTLFATHFHELTELGLMLENVRNCNVAVKEWGDEIIFLRRIEEGPSDKSYGIQVARLAGLPEELLERARGVLSNLEKQMLNSKGMPRFLPELRLRGGQMDLFGGKEEPIIEELLSLPDEIAPEDALRKLRDLKKRAKSSLS
jgi:DNA mismatch repair protein MutS